MKKPNEKATASPMTKPDENPGAIPAGMAAVETNSIPVTELRRVHIDAAPPRRASSASSNVHERRSWLGRSQMIGGEQIQESEVPEGFERGRLERLRNVNDCKYGPDRRGALPL
jgi:hypothetical protein